MTAKLELFRRYPNKIFVETGSCAGDGIAMALETGFEQVYSVELDFHRHRHCISRFGDDLRVHLFLGDSAEVLPRMLDQVHGPATIWLDAHLTEPGGARGPVDPPLRPELEALSRHACRSHDILIDDIRGLYHQDYFQLLEQINPHYTIRLEHGRLLWDVLAASID